MVKPLQGYLGMLCILGLLLAGCSSEGGNGGGSGGGNLQLLTTDRQNVGDPVNADFVAVQDGDGPWVPVPPAATGRYAAAITDGQGRYGVAIVSVDPDNGFIYGHVVHATLAEMPTIPYRVQRPYTRGDITISGTCAGGGAGSSVCCGLFSCLAGEAGGADTYSLPVPAVRQTDLIARSATGDLVYLERDLAATADLTCAIDFTGSNAFTLSSVQTAAVSGGLQPAYLAAYLYTKHGTEVRLAEIADAAVLRYNVLPPAARDAGDRYLTYVDSELAGGGCVDYVMTGGPTDVTVSQSAQPFAPPLIDANAVGGRLAVNLSWTPYAGAQAYDIACSQYAGTFRLWRSTISAGWQQGRAASYTLPDFGSLAGFDAGWRLTADTAAYPLDGEGAVLMGNRPLPELFDLHDMYNYKYVWLPVHFPAGAQARMVYADAAFSQQTASARLPYGRNQRLQRRRAP